MTTTTRRALGRASYTILAMAVTTLMATACGGTTSSSTPTPSPSPSPTPSKATLITSADACSLVTAGDASAALGSTVANPPGGAPIPGACVYTSADGHVIVYVYAQVFSDTTTARAASPERMAASLGNAYGVSNAKEVSGIGDRALEYSATGASGNGIVIFVFKSNAVVMVLITPSPGSSAAVEQMARTAVGNLK